MPSTDFHYEEFEGLLASFYLTLLCLKDRKGEDGEAFQQAVEILNGFSERHNVRLPEEVAKEPRAMQETWGQPSIFTSCFTLLDMMSSFWRDFGVGADPKTQDGIERFRLGRLLLILLDRHKAITAKFQEHEGKQVPIGVQEQFPKMRQSLESILTNEKNSSQAG